MGAFVIFRRSTRFTETVRLLLLPLLLATTIGLTGCSDPGAAFDIGADGSCDPAQLRVTVQARDDADPGLVAIDYVIVNESDAPCTLRGTPAVTIMSAQDDTSIGSALPLNDDPAELVALGANDVAYLFLWTLKSMEDTPTCRGELAASTRIVFPGRTDDAAVVSGTPVGKYCDEPARGTLLVGSFTSEPLTVPGVDDFVPLLF